MVLLVPALEYSESNHVPNLMLLRLKQIHALVLVLAGQKVATGHLRDFCSMEEVRWCVELLSPSLAGLCRPAENRQRQTEIACARGLRPRRRPDTRDDDSTRVNVITCQITSFSSSSSVTHNLAATA
jgi:hypothetical protein